jgi:hypothetical protein
MNNLSDKKIKKLIWGLSTVICCLLIYFVCLPFYQDLSYFTRSFILTLIAIVFTVSLFFVVLLISYVTSLFLIDCFKLSQFILIKNKITGFLTTISILILIISPMISLEKLPNINELYEAFMLYLIFPITIILLSRFVLHKIKKHPILLGLESLIAFGNLSIIYSSKAEIGKDGPTAGLLILFESIAVGLVSIVVNLIEKKKINEISGRTIK